MTCHSHTITPACPIECLRPTLSARTYTPLTQARGAPFDRPRAVADVITLWRTGTLDQIWGLGPRRIGEIEAALVFAGLSRDHDAPPAGSL